MNYILQHFAQFLTLQDILFVIGLTLKIPQIRPPHSTLYDLDNATDNPLCEYSSYA